MKVRINKHLSTFYLIGLAVVVTFLLATAFAHSNRISAAEPPIFFWGDGCPHCEVVKDEVAKQGLDKKVVIDYREIYNNRDNAAFFNEKIKICGISPYDAGVPLVFVNGTCWVGVDEALYALEKAAEEGPSIPATTDNLVAANASVNSTESAYDPVADGKKNTELMLVVIFIGMAGLVGVGYLLQSGKTKKTITATALALFISPLLLSTSAHAVCPVCTVAVGAGLGLSRSLGIDDVISGIWIGGLIVSTIFWMIDWLGKKWKKSQKISILTTLVTYSLVLIPLYIGGIIGHPFNQMWGVDKILLGCVIGSLAFFAAAKLHFLIKVKNSDKAIFPFQKVILPVGVLWLISLIFYLIIY